MICGMQTSTSGVLIPTCRVSWGTKGQPFSLYKDYIGLYYPKRLKVTYSTTRQGSCKGVKNMDGNDFEAQCCWFWGFWGLKSWDFD